DAEMGEAEAPSRHDEGPCFESKRLTADNAGIENPAHQRYGNIQVDQARTEHCNNGNHQDQEWEGNDDIDNPADYRVGPAAVISCDESHKHADNERDGDADGADLQVDARAVDHAGQDVPPELIGAEDVCRAWRLQASREVEGDGVVRRQQRRKQGGQNKGKHTGGSGSLGPAVTDDRPADAREWIWFL